MKTLRHVLLSLALLGIGSVASGQIVLTGTAYTQDFSGLGSTLPAGWSVYTGSTATTYGTAATFTTTATAWNGATAGTFFRNVASNNILASDNSTTQNADTNRALGWKPLTAASRDGSIVFEISNTSGFQNFNLSVDVFTGNNAGTTNQTYTLEYRIGSSGAFTALGTYSTTVPFGASTLSANSITLSAMNNQSSLVAFRFRNTSGASDSTYDTLVLDNLSLTYAATAVPEPATTAAILGALVLAGTAIRRRKFRPAA